jgi:hypothetical protein
VVVLEENVWLEDVDVTSKQLSIPKFYILSVLCPFHPKSGIYSLNAFFELGT